MGGGTPSQNAVSDLLKTIAADSDWYPGKNIDEQPKGGRPTEFTPQMQQACANAAMALKRYGGHVIPYHKTALSDEAHRFRLKWACAQERLGRTDGWFFQHVVFVDPCNTVLSDSHKTGFDENQSTYGKGPRWMSKDKRMSSRNLRASPYATKQARKGDMRAWWFIVLARGKVGVVFMPRSWRQTDVGIAQFAES